MTRLGSTDNHYRLAIKEINKIISNKKLKLLEIGAGEKLLENYLPANIIYDSLDYQDSNKSYTYNHDLNVGKIPVKSKSYDIIVCNETLEHLLYPEKIIEDIKRVAKDEAIFFFSLPNEYNFIMRLYYMLAIKTKTEIPFKVVEKGAHIHKPRVKDILNLFSNHFRIIKVYYIWQSRSSERSRLARILDNAISPLVKLSPSLFSRCVALMVKNKSSR